MKDPVTPIRAASQAPLFDRGTGTNGPARKVASTQIPYGNALRHITRHVISILDDLGEQWSDAAKQDLISTVYIAAAREHRISYDFTEQT